MKDIEQMVCQDILARQQVGINKYGTTVAQNPLELKQWLQHAYEECLDQAVYLRRAMEELKTDNQERFFCERCGKRLSGGIHTCTPPAEAEKQIEEQLKMADENQRIRAELKFNTIAEAEKQEPHSWYSAEHDEWMTNKTRKEHEALNSYTHKVGGFDLPLYTTPPQREWVGLTDEEVIVLMKQFPDSLTQYMTRAIEAKLKEKNT